VRGAAGTAWPTICQDGGAGGLTGGQGTASCSAAARARADGAACDGRVDGSPMGRKQPRHVREVAGGKGSIVEGVNCPPHTPPIAKPLSGPAHTFLPMV
jgi:hypothetical protein